MTDKYGYLSVLQDAEGTGSPDWCSPYRCWHHWDRGRFKRASGSGPDQMAHNDSHDYQRVRGRNLTTLHVETGGGYRTENDTSRDNQLEVCRLCGAPLNLPRDKYGNVARGKGEQPEFCSKRCRMDVKNARARQKRAAKSPRRKGQRRLPDLSTVSIAGIGDLAISAEAWNRLQPRNNPDAYGHAFEPSTQPRPWFNPPKVATSKYEYKLPVHRLIAHLRHRPCQSADMWIRVGLRSAVLTPERIARRYGTGGTPAPPELAPGWDCVTTWWRFIPRQQQSVTKLARMSESVWYISHPESEHANT